MDLPVNYHKLDWRKGEKRVVREAYVEIQNGLCYWCNAPLDGPPKTEKTESDVDWNLFPGGRKFLNHPVHLQHNHSTGMTEGAVHSLCNAVMWQYHGR